VNRIWPGRSCAHSPGWGSFHLHDHLRGREDLGRRVGNARAGSAVDVVARPDPGAGTGFDHDLVAGMDVFTNRAGREPDAGTHAF
jgi:hypothetical protein